MKNLKDLAPVKEATAKKVATVVAEKPKKDNKKQKKSDHGMNVSLGEIAHFGDETTKRLFQSTTSSR